MTREAQLRYCKVCQHKTFDVQHGIICALTGRQADFDPTCPSFQAEAGRSVDESFAYNAQAVMATGTQRFVNKVVDFIAFYIFFIIVFILAIIWGDLFLPEETAMVFDEEGTPWWFYVLFIGSNIFYYTVLEASSGRTVGKLVTGTRVVNKHGRTPEMGTILLRSLVRLVPFEALSFLGNVPRGWHDAWTDTWVVEKDSNQTFI